MKCTFIYDKNGRVTGVACGRPSPKKCSVCGKPGANKLCDFILKPENKTCDQPLCSSCAVRVAPNTDYCPHHRKGLLPP